MDVAGRSGGGEGNRTLVVSLGSFCSAIELHPHLASILPPLATLPGRSRPYRRRSSQEAACGSGPPLTSPHRHPIRETRRMDAPLPPSPPLPPPPPPCTAPPPS